MRKSRLLAAGASVVLAVSGTASAEDAASLAKKFGAREAIEGISLSPDGTHVAIIGPKEPKGEAVLIGNLVEGGGFKPVLTSSGEGDHLFHCSWPTNARVVCRIVFTQKPSKGGILGFTRTVAVNIDGSDVKLLTKEGTSRSLGVTLYGGGVIDWNGGKSGEVLMMRQFVPETDIGTRLVQKGEGLGVERVDTESLRRQTLEQPVPNAAAYITDGRGTVRIMAVNPPTASGYDSGTFNYLYRKPGDRRWDSLSTVQVDAQGNAKGFTPVAVDPALNLAYGFDDTNGYKALYSETLDGSEQRNVVLERPGVDVDELVQIGRDGRVVGASYATDKRRVDYFDPQLKRLAASLGAALPGKPLIDFADASVDEGKLLLLAGSDVDPGMFYLFDKSTRHLEEVLPIRPQLAGVSMGAMKPVEFPAADGTIIPGYLTLPPGSSGNNLPAIVMPHGGPSARDEWGFDWLVQFFAARGFAVLQPNYRGSSGYGLAWFEKNGFKSWRIAIGDVDDAGRWLVKQGIAAPDKLAIVGWSYGGYAALQSGVTEPDLYKAIVAIAPVTDLDQLRDESRGYANFLLVNSYIGNGPYIEEGSPARHADKITVPVLMFHGDWDTNVGIEESRLMAEKLKGAGKQVQLVEFPGLAHSLYDDSARAQLLEQSDAFLRKTLHLPPQ